MCSSIKSQLWHTASGKYRSSSPCQWQSFLLCQQFQPAILWWRVTSCPCTCITIIMMSKFHPTPDTKCSVAGLFNTIHQPLDLDTNQQHMEFWRMVYILYIAWMAILYSPIKLKIYSLLYTIIYSTILLWTELPTPCLSFPESRIRLPHYHKNVPLLNS